MDDYLSPLSVVLAGMLLCCIGVGLHQWRKKADEYASERWDEEVQSALAYVSKFDAEEIHCAQASHSDTQARD